MFGQADHVGLILSGMWLWIWFHGAKSTNNKAVKADCVRDAGVLMLCDFPTGEPVRPHRENSMNNGKLIPFTGGMGYGLSLPKVLV
jgi:hypothetical protein